MSARRLRGQSLISPKSLLHIGESPISVTVPLMPFYDTGPDASGHPKGQIGDKPIGVVFWGTVSDEVAKRLAEGTSKLRPQDWKSGDNLWVVEVIAPFGGAEEMVKDLKTAVFSDREIKMLVVTDGKRDVRVV